MQKNAYYVYHVSIHTYIFFNLDLSIKRRGSFECQHYLSHVSHHCCCEKTAIFFRRQHLTSRERTNRTICGRGKRFFKNKKFVKARAWSRRLLCGADNGRSRRPEPRIYALTALASWVWMYVNMECVCVCVCAHKGNRLHCALTTPAKLGHSMETSGPLYGRPVKRKPCTWRGRKIREKVQ